MTRLKMLVTQIIQLIAPELSVKFVRAPLRIYGVSHYKIRDGF
jgi:hypothetical protein